MKRPHVQSLLAGVPILLTLACATNAASPSAAPAAKPTPTGLHFDVAAVDPSVNPCVDFYDFACGGWRATHPIPADQTKWDRYAEMAAVNLERTRSIVEDAARSASTPAEQRVGAYHASCMDQAAIEASGLAPVASQLASIQAIQTAKDATAVLAEFQSHDLQVLIAAYPETDPQDATQTVLWLDKGALGLPDPADYAKTDDAAVKLRAQYLLHLEKVLVLLGSNEADAKVAAAGLLRFEAGLARNALSVVDRRNRDLQVHPMTVAQLSARWPALDWKLYLAGLGVPDLQRVNVAQPAWLDGVDAALANKDLAPFRDSLRIMLARAFSLVLPGALEEAVFDFRQRTLRGAKALAPRVVRCLKHVNSDLGEDIGRVFLARHFKEDARARMTRMTDALTAAMERDIGTRDWLGEPARAAARDKLAKMLLVTGASRQPRSLDGLHVAKDDPVGNAWRAQALQYAQALQQIGQPTNREKFFEALPQDLDAFGSKSKNATGFTAGFLQPPIFDPHMDDAVNFGGLGSVVGHELSHQFDDEGRKFDGDGNVRPWWADEDVARFNTRAQCFVEEYAGFKTSDGTPLNGKLTLGENIADNGGIRLSHAALHPSETGPKLDGYTPAQRFFLAWAHLRCENVTPERERQLARSDQHAPGRWRVNGVVSNMPEFASAFSCPAGTPMAPEKRCQVW